MAVAFDAVGPSASCAVGAAGASTLSWTHTAGTGGSAVLVFISAGTGSGNAGDVGSAVVTYGGNAMALLGSRAANDQNGGGVLAYGITGQSSGANTVSVTYTLPSGASLTGRLIGVSASFTGANSFGTPVTAAGTGTNVENTGSVTVTGTGATSVVCAGAADGTGGQAQTAGTNRWLLNHDANSAAGNVIGGTIAGGGDVTQTWTWSFDWWAALGVEVLTQASATATAGLASATAAALEWGGPVTAFPGCAAATGAAIATNQITTTIARDGSTPPAVDSISNTGTDVTTASFSPPARSLIVIVVNVGFFGVQASSPVITVADSLSNSYTAGPGTFLPNYSGSYIFSRYYPAAPGAITVTVTRTAVTTRALVSVVPYVLTGVRPSQAGAASATGGVSSTGIAVTALTGAIIPAVPGSWIICGVTPDNAVSLAGSALTLDHSVTDVTDTEAAAAGHAATPAGHRLAAVPGFARPGLATPGAAPEIVGFTAGSASSYSWAALEILPTTDIAAPAVAAVASGAARGAVPVLTVVAGTAVATGAAFNPAASTAASVTALPGRAAATGAGLGAVPVIAPAAGLAPATGAAQGAVPVPGAAAAPAVASGAAQGAVPVVAPTAGLPAATGAGQVIRAGHVPDVASATGAAQGAVPVVVPVAGAAAGTAASLTVPFPVISPALEAYGFGTFPQVPAGAVVLSVIASITQHGSNTGIIPPSYELWDGTSARIGPAVTGTTSVSASYVDTVVFTGVSYSQLATLRLRIYAESGTPNSGATVSVDAVSLSVSWAPNQDAAVSPGLLTVTPVFPVATAGSTTTMTPGVLAVVPVFPAATAGFLAATVSPGVLAVVPVFPAATASSGLTVPPGVLSVVPVFPVISDVTAPGWASAQDIPAAGVGSWLNPGNVTGSPDSSLATWTVP